MKVQTFYITYCIYSIMAGRPVLSSSLEYHLWKTLDSRTFPNGGPMALVKEMEAASDGTLNSAVLVMLIEALDRDGLADRDVLGRIVSRSRATDCLPSVRACQVLTDHGDIEGASAMLAMSSPDIGVHPRAIAEARMLLKDGDMDGAKEAALRAYNHEPACREAYAILTRTDPNGDWPQRENILDILEGKSPDNPVGTGAVQELYTIYYDWFNGRRMQATDRLVRSESYRARDSDFMIASARMSVDENDWHSALMVYNDLINAGSPEFVVLEAAEAALSAGDAIRAQHLFSRADMGSVRVRKGLVRCCLLSEDADGLMDAVRSLLDHESAGSDEFVEIGRLLMSLDMDREAKSLIDRYSLYIGDDADTFTLKSMLQMRSGDHMMASIFARKAVRCDHNNTVARTQLARVLRLTGKDKEAEVECNAILAQSKDDRDALGLLLEISQSKGDESAIISIARRILAVTPNDVSARVAMASAMARSGEQHAAEDAFRAALKAECSKESSILIISAMLACGMDRAVLSVITNVERQFSRDPMVLRLKGNAEYSLGEYLDASVTFAQAASLDPNDPMLWHSKGMADEARGDMEAAEDAYNHAILLDQGVATYWISKATIRERFKDRHGAIESLNRAIELDSRSIDALIRKAVILSSSGKIPEALFYVRQAAVIEPDNVRVMDMEADLLAALGSVSDAIRVLKRRLEKTPSGPVGVRLARLHVSRGDDAAAIALMDEMIRMYPDSEMLVDERNRIGSGTVVIPEEEPEDVTVDVDDKPVDAPAAYSMSRSLLEAGEYKGAMREIDSALSVDPDNVMFHCMKARIALSQGDADGATILMGNIVKKHSDDPEVHTVLALARETKGDTKGALGEIDRAIECGVDSPEVHRIRGRILSSMGRHEDSLLAYRKVLEIDPDDLGTMEEMAIQTAAMGDIPGAGMILSELLTIDPKRISAIMIQARMCVYSNDAEGVRQSYDLLSAAKDVPEPTIAEMNDLMGRVGLTPSVVSKKSDGNDYDKSVKRYAEKVLRKAYTTKTSANDPDIADAVGLDESTARSVREYLSDLDDVPSVPSSGPEFEKMERLSHTIIMKLGWTDLEDEPILPLEKVFGLGEFRDADSAKMLVVYVRDSVRSCSGTPNDRLSKLALGLPKGMTIYQIMEQCDLGVREAVMTKSLIV